ncbi:hypothetical protein FVB9288_01998 [Flavobacterium sp. CECT 9288]|nr:hypothetical protein FVB9288_01998 [Flavobacterium sp. CECT 9288]
MKLQLDSKKQITLNSLRLVTIEFSTNIQRGFQEELVSFFCDVATR